MGDCEEVWAPVKVLVILVVKLSRMDSVEMIGGCVRSVEFALDFELFGSLLGQDAGNPRPCSDTMSHSIHFSYIFPLMGYKIYRYKNRFSGSYY